MVAITEETYENNGIEAIVNNNGALWLNEKRIQKGLDQKNLPIITGKNESS